MFNVFKITKAGGKPDSPDLLGLLIIQTNQGFFLVDPEPEDVTEPPRIMSKSKYFDYGGHPLAEFRFLFKKIDWTLTVNSLTSMEMQGRWKNPKRKDHKHEYTAVEDHWVATGTGTGTGTEVPEGDDEARAASATN